MKTKEELNALKAEAEAVNKKLSELAEDELQQVTGGTVPPETPFPTKEPFLYEEHGIGWTLEPKKREEELEVKNAGTYTIEYAIPSKEG